LGGSDEVVNPGQSLEFLSKNLQRNEIKLKIIPELGHRIPLEVFKQATREFFKEFCY
jgi:pimeloyl-ACP methyl ester carboxylesterase